MINRNDKCSCGSGKKYKKCCLNNLTVENKKKVKDVNDISLLNCNEVQSFLYRINTQFSNCDEFGSFKLEDTYWLQRILRNAVDTYSYFVEGEITYDIVNGLRINEEIGLCVDDDDVFIVFRMYDGYLNEGEITAYFNAFSFHNAQVFEPYNEYQCLFFESLHRINSGFFEAFVNGSKLSEHMESSVGVYTGNMFKTKFPTNNEISISELENRIKLVMS